MPDEPLSALSPRTAAALRLALGGLLGLGPVLLVAASLVAFAPGGMGAAPFVLIILLTGLGLFVADALVLLPLLAFASTRHIGLGLAVGFAITCGFVVYFVTQGYLNKLFG
jgi:hypothetical protein